MFIKILINNTRIVFSVRLKTYMKNMSKERLHCYWILPGMAIWFEYERLLIINLAVAKTSIALRSSVTRAKMKNN